MPRPPKKPAKEKPREESPAEHVVDPRLTYVYGMVAGWARSSEQKQALLMLIGGAKLGEVAKAMGMKYNRVRSMWRHFLGKVKDDQKRIQQKGIADGEDTIENDFGQEQESEHEEDIEDERPITDTSDDDEAEEVEEDERW